MTAGTASASEALSGKPSQRLFSKERSPTQQPTTAEPSDVGSPNIESQTTKSKNNASPTTTPSATNASSSNPPESEPPHQWNGLTVLQQDQTAPLSECVRNALRYYLHNMNGHDINDLYRMVLDEVERPLVETVMENTNQNQTIAARMLGMSRGTLRKKLKAFEQD